MVVKRLLNALGIRKKKLGEKGRIPELGIFEAADGRKYRIFSSEGLIEYRDKSGRKFFRLLIEPIENE